MLDMSDESAVELLRSALRHQADHTGRGSTVFCRIVGGQDLDFRDRVQALRTVDDRSLTISIHGGAVHSGQVLARPPAVDGITSAAETVAHVVAEGSAHDSGFELHGHKRIAAAYDQFGDLSFRDRTSQHCRLSDDLV